MRLVLDTLAVSALIFAKQRLDAPRTLASIRTWTKIGLTKS
jgi:hypothetical protein